MQTPRPDSKDSLYSDAYKDIYFCEEDGLAEGDHVFLKGNGLPERWKDKASFVIAETGFGTGLNFLASWLAWERTAGPSQHLTYISFEKFPLTPERIREALSRWKNELAGKLDIMLEKYPARISGWHPVRISDAITLLLIFDDVNRALPELEADVDAWFLDGFAPAKNPEMWSGTVFRAIADNSHKETTVASFTAAGLVKRGLREVGFHIAKTRGFGRKRDMIFGHFLEGREKPDKKIIKSVAVIGGGLAGCHAAHRLKQERLGVDLYEAGEIAAGASGNMRGLFNPRFTAARNSVSDFYASAYALALRQYKGRDDIGFKACGSLHLFTDEDKEKRLTGAYTTWDWHPDHMRVVDKDEASEIAGTDINKKALFLSDAGFVSPKDLCRTLVRDINVVPEKVENFVREAESWIVNGRVYDAVVIASGAGALEIEQIKSFPLSTVRGQIAVAEGDAAAAKIKCNICYGGYCSPEADGAHVIGSTFQPWLKDTEVRQEDNIAILANLKKQVPSLDGAFAVTEARASLRVAARDRFPVIGAVGGYDNLYISAAHGSHGLISSALGAEIIAAEITGRVLPCPRSVRKNLSPQRFTNK